MSKLFDEMNKIQPISGAEERMYQHILEKASSKKAVPLTPEAAKQTAKPKTSAWKTVLTAAAAVVITGGAVTGGIALTNHLNTNSSTVSSEPTTEANETLETAENAETEETTETDLNNPDPNFSVRLQPVYTVDVPMMQQQISVDGGENWTVGLNYHTTVVPELHPVTNITDRMDFTKDAAVTIFSRSAKDNEVLYCKVYDYYNEENIIELTEKVGTVIPAGGKAAFIVPITKFSKTGVYRFEVVTKAGHRVCVDFFAGSVPELTPLTVNEQNFSPDILYKLDFDNPVLNQLSRFTPVDVKSLPYFDGYYQEFLSELEEGDGGYMTFDSLEEAEANNYSYINALNYYIGCNRGEIISVARWYVPYFDGPPGPDAYWSELIYTDKNGNITEKAYQTEGYITSIHINGDEVIFNIHGKGIFSLDTNTNEVKLLVECWYPELISADDKYILYAAPDDMTNEFKTARVLIRESGEIIDTKKEYSSYDGFTAIIHNDILYTVREDSYNDPDGNNVFDIYSLATGNKGTITIDNYGIPSINTLELGNGYSSDYWASEQYIAASYSRNHPHSDYIAYLKDKEIKNVGMMYNRYMNNWYQKVIHVIDKKNGTERYVLIPSGIIPDETNDASIYIKGIYGNKLLLYYESPYFSRKPCHLEINLDTNEITVLDFYWKLTDMGYSNVYNIYYNDTYGIYEAIVSESEGITTTKFDIGFTVSDE